MLKSKIAATLLILTCGSFPPIIANTTLKNIYNKKKVILQLVDIYIIIFKLFIKLSKKILSFSQKISYVRHIQKWSYWELGTVLDWYCLSLVWIVKYRKRLLCNNSSVLSLFILFESYTKCLVYVYCNN